jgi:hypothetical protein
VMPHRRMAVGMSAQQAGGHGIFGKFRRAS